MPAKIFLWVGHPREDSLSHGMADAYQRGAEEKGAEVRRMHLHDMQFDPDLTYGYHQRKDHEPALTEWQEHITWCTHTCWAYPIWWGSMPAKMKGVIDRAFLPGFAMAYHEKDPWWDKLLKGRSGDLLLTSDAPAWFDKIMYGRPGANQAKRAVMKFSGISPVRVLQVGTVKSAPKKKIEKWLNQAYKMGIKAGLG